MVRRVARPSPHASTVRGLTLGGRPADTASVRLRITVTVLLAVAVGLGAASCLGGEEPVEETALPRGPHAQPTACSPTARRACHDGAAAACVRGRSGRPQARRASFRDPGQPRTRRRAADPYDTAEALSASGRQSGYAVDFFDTDLSALLDGGVFAARSSVELFASPESASASIVRELAELQRAEGHKVDGEVRIERCARCIDLPEAIGFRVQERLAGTLVRKTYVRLRHGSIVGTAALVRADRRDVQDRVAELARALERRIDGGSTAGSQPSPLPPGPGRRAGRRVVGQLTASWLIPRDPPPPGRQLAALGHEPGRRRGWTPRQAPTSRSARACLRGRTASQTGTEAAQARQMAHPAARG